ncbi:MAG: hypothetical protein F7B17_08510 [Desulfurococcales archaeon]|nr:hypothetical protein [Desulfurococcales archaeon]
MESLMQAYELVRAERVRGSSWALATLARGVLEDLESGRRLDCGRAASLIRRAFPGSGALENLAWIVSGLCGEWGRLEDSLRRLLDLVDRGAVEASSRAASVIGGFDVVVTISFSRAVSEALAAARPGRVVVLQSLPGGEGVFAARHLRERGLRVELAPDSSAGRFLGEGSVAVFGADAAGIDGCVANKLGSLTLAAAARALGSSVIAVFESYKIVERPICRGLGVEERSYTVEGWGKVRYPLLDVTPPELVTVVVTERAVARPERGWMEALRNSFLEEVLGA